MEKEENILGTEKIGKLIRKFSIPCIISLLVNSLYNIVDQIFIGWGVGYLGNGATNVVFPLIMIGLAFSLMFGDGASAYLSLKLGEKKKDEAAKGVGNTLAISAIVSVLFCAITLIFLPQLLTMFGCTEALKEYALKYGYVIAIGLPFSMIGTTLNSIIRADGSPKYSMTTMLIGAVLNTILDPIFIFVFKMGVEGAAIATVISQVLVFVLNALYIKKFKSIKLNKETLKIKASVGKKVTNKETTTNTQSKLSKHVVITIAREYASGGRYIGKLVADKLGIKLYDNEFISKVAEETGLSEEYIENNEQKRDALASLNNGYYSGLNNSDELFIKESELIKEVADKESCVIVGRCADFILSSRKNVINVFVYSDMEDKINRATTYYGMDKSKAEKEIKRIDKLRANHYKYYTEKEWDNHSNYDICINSDAFGVEKSADLICESVESKLEMVKA